MPLDSKSDAMPTKFKSVGTRPIRPDGVDKVTGRARFGADMQAPGMLVGRILRSPHAHAKIRKIDTSKAEALPGVKAVITSKDIPVQQGCDMDVLVNVMARDKALYDGHAVAAVAAVDAAVAREALKLIEVDYKVLPHVTDVDEAMKPDAPVLHKHIEHDYHQDLLETAGHVKGKVETTLPAGKRPSNIAGRYEFGHGDIKKGFAAADVIVEHEFKTEATHQGYIEPHACLASVSSDGWGELWVCTQGHFMVRDVCASLLGMDVSRLRVTASEIGGGFGGKTTVFIEPVALALSRKAGRPVKVVMSREEVFRATGPTSSASMMVRIGAKKDGTFTAADAILKFQGGAFPGSPVEMGAMCAFACYELKNVRIIGYDVVTNRPKQAAYRAPGAPMAAFAVEACVGELSEKLGIDAVDLRLKNAAKEGTVSSYGPTFGPVGLVETLKAAKKHKNYKVKLGPNQGRGVASGFWFNFGGQTCATLNLNSDGTLGLAVGTPEIGGSRASMCLMAAEELGIPYDQVRAIVADTASLGYNDILRGQPGDVLQRAGDHPGCARVQGEDVCPCRHDLGYLRRCGRVEGRSCPAGRRQCRQFRPAIDRGACGTRQPGRAARSPVIVRSMPTARPPASRPTSSTSRSIQRLAPQRCCAIWWCRMPARRSIRPMSKASSRAVPSRASVGF